MKKLLLILICLFVSFEVKSEEIRSDELTRKGIKGGLFYKKNSDYPFSGKVYSYFDNGNLSGVYHVKKGKLHGEFVSYWREGNINQKTNYKNGKEHGKYFMYNPDGYLFLRGEYFEGVKHGEQSVYDDGILLQTGNYRYGKKDGEWFDWDYDGSETKKIFKNGKEIK